LVGLPSSQSLTNPPTTHQHLISNNETADNDNGIINNPESTSNNDIESASAQSQPGNASTSLGVGSPEPNHNTTSIVTSDEDEAVESEGIEVPLVAEDNCFGSSINEHIQTESDYTRCS